jgi:hypothetical protein
MPIDSRIALGYQAPQIESPVNMMMAAQKMQSGQQENQLRQFQMQQMQQEAERTNQLRQTLSSIDPTTPGGESDYGNALLKSGDVKGAHDYFASLAARRKSENEADLAKLTLRTTQAGIVASEAGALAQHPALNFDMVKSWAATHAKDGFLTPEAMQNLDAMQNAQPDELRGALGRLQQQSVSAQAQLEQAAAAKRDAENKRHNAEQEALTKRGQNITARGQDLTATNKTAEKPLTALQQQNLRRAKAEDADKYKSADTITTELETIADKLLGNPDKKIKPHPGLGGITGLAGVLPNMYGGDARAAQQQLETFKGKVKAFGRQLASVHGKLGNMAVQEWKILSDSVENIDPTAPNFAEQLRDVVRQSRNQATSTQSRYEATYDEKLPGQQNTKARAMSGEDKQALDWANANPNDDRAAKIKQRLGM